MPIPSRPSLWRRLVTACPTSPANVNAGAAVLISKCPLGSTSTWMPLSLATETAASGVRAPTLASRSRLSANQRIHHQHPVFVHEQRIDVHFVDRQVTDQVRQRHD